MTRATYVDVDEAVDILTAEFPGIKGIRNGYEWGSGPDSIFLGNVAEGGQIDDFPACDFYADDPCERVYIMGVHKKLRSRLEELGYFVEAYDAGTYIAYIN